MENLEGDPSFIKKNWWKLIIVLFLTFIAIVFIFKFKNKNKESSNNNFNQEYSQINSNYSGAEKVGKEFSNNKCSGTEKNKLGTLPMKYEDFSMILPYGLTVGGHVTPIDHQYFSPTVFNSPRDTYPVYTMADATITDISPRTNDRGTEYRFVFSMSCKLFYYYDLVTSLAPEIKTEWEKSQNNINFSVKEGQLIGYIGGQTLDFAVWDMDESLSGFVVPEHYEGESWKIHTADPLNYYTNELKEKVLSKYIRTAEPRSGKIDYDIDGKLIGNWFIENTGGYSGGRKSEYWTTHLSIAPDAYDPTSIVVSLGDYAGQPTQFGVKGNTPDPASVDVNSGMIKYELVQQDWVKENGQHWDRMSLAKNIKAKNHEEKAEGTVLIQMLENRKLKMEVFPNKTASQVSSFTSNAKIYER